MLECRLFGLYQHSLHSKMALESLWTSLMCLSSSVFASYRTEGGRPSQA